MTTTQTPPEEVTISPGQTTVEEQLAQASQDQKKARQAAQNNAYTQASATLREKYRDEFDGYLAVEYEKRGMVYRRRLTPEERAEAEKQERLAKASAQFEKLMEDFPEFAQELAAKAQDIEAQRTEPT